MPFVVPPAKVLVTGASGFIALWVVRQLLHAGYAVRGTVRSAEKGTTIRALMARLEGDDAVARFEYVVVRDIAAADAFDEAVKGVDVIEHTASPVNLSDKSAVDPQELIGPAVGGTLNLLSSALKHAPNLKRIVITSSVAAVYEMFAPFKNWDESDWDNEAVREIEEKGSDATMLALYRASKTLAEKAAWDFVDDHHDEINWDLVTLCPAMVYRPPLADVASTALLNNTSKAFYDIVITGEKPDEFYVTEGHGGFVDVRDVADAHVRAASVAEAGGKRFIVSSKEYKWQDFLDAANSLTVVGLPKGVPGAGKTAKHARTYNNTRAKTILGIEFRDVSQMTKDMLDYYIKQGWVSMI